MSIFPKNQIKMRKIYKYKNFLQMKQSIPKDQKNNQKRKREVKREKIQGASQRNNYLLNLDSQTTLETTKMIIVSHK